MSTDLQRVTATSVPQSIFRALTKDASGIVLRFGAGVTFLFLYVPIVITWIISFSSGITLMFPPPGFSFMWYKNMWGILTTGERTIYGVDAVTFGDTIQLLPSI